MATIPANPHTPRGQACCAHLGDRKTEARSPSRSPPSGTHASDFLVGSSPSSSNFFFKKRGREPQAIQKGPFSAGETADWANKLSAVRCLPVGVLFQGPGRTEVMNAKNDRVLLCFLRQDSMGLLCSWPSQGSHTCVLREAFHKQRATWLLLLFLAFKGSKYLGRTKIQAMLLDVLIVTRQNAGSVRAKGLSN